MDPTVVGKLRRDRHLSSLFEHCGRPRGREGERDPLLTRRPWMAAEWLSEKRWANTTWNSYRQQALKFIMSTQLAFISTEADAAADGGGREILHADFTYIFFFSLGRTVSALNFIHGWLHPDKSPEAGYEQLIWYHRQGGVSWLECQLHSIWYLKGTL